MKTSNRKGLRGYMGARMEMGRSVPQHIQQMVMREYCRARGTAYLLAATEYRMEGCTMMLDALLDELDHIEGIVMYSLALLPQSRAKREVLYTRVFAKGCMLHMAAEGIELKNMQDAEHLEESLQVAEIVQLQPPEILAYLKDYDSHATF